MGAASACAPPPPPPPNYTYLCHTILVPGPNLLQVTTPTATTLPITWTVSGFVDRFEIAYSYTINGCLKTGGPLAVNVDGAIRSYTLEDLTEDSNYTITVRAARTTTAATTADTLTSGRVHSYSIMCNADNSLCSSQWHSWVNHLQ